MDVKYNIVGRPSGAVRGISARLTGVRDGSGIGGTAYEVRRNDGAVIASFALLSSAEDYRSVLSMPVCLPYCV